MKEGDVVPNFKLCDEKGNIFELYKNLDNLLLIVFYPKDNTPVCSTQLAEYNHHLDDFNKLGIRVVGISSDNTDSHLAFCTNLKLNFPLLSDNDKKVSRLFGAINLLGIPKRKLVLIDSEKRALWISSTLSITYIKSGEILNKINLLNSKEMT
jgi:peroxiredoxin